MAGIPGSGGKKGRSGRKSKAEEMGLVALLDKCWTKKDREACITKLAASAKDPLSGDRMEAVKLLMSYAFGKPTEKHEHSGKDGDVFEVVVRHVSSTTEATD